MLALIYAQLSHANRATEFHRDQLFNVRYQSLAAEINNRLYAGYL